MRTALVLTALLGLAQSPAADRIVFARVFPQKEPDAKATGKKRARRG